MSVLASLLTCTLGFAPEPSAESQAAAEQAEPEQAEESEESDYAFHSPPPTTEPVPVHPRLRVFAGAQLMTRTEFIRTRELDGESTPQTVAPTRLRARLGAEAGDLKLLGEFQDARNLGDPLGGARMGFHQLFGAYEVELARAALRVSFGRQELADNTRHLFWSAPWGAGMRSFDAVTMKASFARGGIELFAGSLARPLLSSPQRLSEHVSSSVNLTWQARGWFEALEALHLDLYVSGAHIRNAGETRDIVTNGLYLHGKLYPGLSYLVDGRLQLGQIAVGRGVQQHLAGAVYGKLTYLTPEGLGAEHKLRLGGTVGLDFASGNRCTTTEFSGFGSCTDGVNRDYYAPWMARHAHFGRGDRFLSNNVIDQLVGLRLLHQAFDKLSLELDVFNHLFIFPEPGGRWQSISTAIIGVDPDNQNRWAADGVDIEATLRYAWLRLDLGWHLVQSLAGGRAISGVSSWQRVYFELTAEF